MLSDAAYEEAGATISDDVWNADVVVKVAPPSDAEIAKLGDDTVLIGFLGPLSNPKTTQALADAGVTAFAMEAIPRISRAQSMDALSSQSNVAGYKSVLVATNHLGRFLPMMMTAAGTVPPAKVLVLGAGVAGLQAIATARRLGAQVTGYDVRAAVAEQVRSLGAQFLELEAGKGAEGEGGYARELTDDEKAGPAAGARRQDRDVRRRHHDRARAGPAGAAPRDRRERREDEARQRDRRPRGGDGRQLRADRARRDRRQARRDDRLAAEPAGDDGRALLVAVLAQRPVAARAARSARTAR